MSNTRRGDAADVFFCAVTLVVLLGCLVASLIAGNEAQANSLKLGTELGIIAGRTEMERRAVAAGVGEYVIKNAETGETEFRFKVVNSVEK